MLAQQSEGVVTFFHVIIVLACIGAVVFFAYLFRSAVKKLYELLKQIPKAVYEVLFHAISLGTLLGGYFGVEGALRPYMGFIGCLLFVASLSYTAKIHKLDASKLWFPGTLFAVFTASTVVFHSPLTGFMAVCALLWAVGFTAETSPLCYAFGFKNDSDLGKATSTAFTILIAFVVMQIAGVSNGVLGDFKFGALFMGSFVGYLGLLIASSRWYTERKSSYAVLQVITVVAGVAALFVGSVFEIGELQKIGGTFFIIFFFEKLIELLSTRKPLYAFWGLCLCALAAVVSFWGMSHPDTLAQYLP